MKVFTSYLFRNKWFSKVIFSFLSKEKQERIIITRLREEFELFGLDTSDLSDEDIKEGMGKVGEVMSKIGFTMDEVGQALQGIAQIMNKY